MTTTKQKKAVIHVSVTREQRNDLLRISALRKIAGRPDWSHTEILRPYIEAALDDLMRKHDLKEDVRFSVVENHR